MGGTSGHENLKNEKKLQILGELPVEIPLCKIPQTAVTRNMCRKADGAPTTFFFFFPSFFLTMFIEVKWTAQERGPKFPLCPESDYSFGRHGGTNKHKLNAKAETWSSFFSSNNSFQKYAESQNPSYLSNCGSTLTVRNLRLYLTLALVWSSDLGSWIISTITSITRGLSPYARRHFLNEKCGSIF